MRTAVVLVGFLFGVAFAAPVPKELKKADDKVRLVGTWKIDRATAGGQAVAQYSPAHTLTFRADGVLVFDYPDGSKPQAAEWTLDATAAPKRISWQMTGSGTDYRRAYTFQGDRLVIARTQSNGPPPTVDPGPSVTVIEYVRAAK